MMKIEVYHDPKKDIQFWLDALSNPNITKESKEMLNQCLQMQLKQYTTPIHILKLDK